MTGLPYFARAMPDFRRMWKAPRGRDVAGVVAQVGPGVTVFAPGDEVMGIVARSRNPRWLNSSTLVRKLPRLSLGCSELRAHCR